jgi:hypothetical protein
VNDYEIFIGTTTVLSISGPPIFAPVQTGNSTLPGLEFHTLAAYQRS